MSTIAKDTLKGTSGSDAQPDLNTILREMIDDMVAMNQGLGTVVAPAASVALTSSQNSTTNASDPTTTQALANALKVSYNALQVDVAAIRTKLDLVITALSNVASTGAVTLKSIKG